VLPTVDPLQGLSNDKLGSGQDCLAARRIRTHGDITRSAAGNAIPACQVVATRTGSPQVKGADRIEMRTLTLRKHRTAIALVTWLATFVVCHGNVNSQDSADPVVYPAEIGDLDLRFRKLLRERVTQVFVEEVAKLDSGYLGGIARGIDAEQAAGRLDGVLVFETEKARIEAGEAMPETDEEGSPQGLKDLRSVYRAEYVKLLAKRSGNLKELFGPFNQHLGKMESDYTKAGKLDEAKAVRAYRLDLAAELAEMGGTEVSAGSSQASAGPGPLEGRVAGEVREFGGIEMAWCPPGTFTMGSPPDESGRLEDEAQVRTTLSRGFWLAKTETTQEDWERSMGTNPSYYKGDRSPVERISWDEANAYVAKLNETQPLPGGWKWALPTEAQWEYACRAGTTTVFHTGSALGEEEAKIKAPGGTASQVQVGSHEPNAWGLHDMHGNVREWCADWHSPTLSGGIDPVGPESGTIRVRRGGSWNHEPAACRSAVRHKGPPDDRNSDLGVRPAIVAADE